jgi:hypothetical protein
MEPAATIWSGRSDAKWELYVLVRGVEEAALRIATSPDGCVV